MEKLNNKEEQLLWALQPFLSTLPEKTSRFPVTLKPREEPEHFSNQQLSEGQGMSGADSTAFI